MAVRFGTIALLSVLGGLLSYLASNGYGGENAMARIILAMAFTIFFAMLLMSVLSKRLSLLLFIFALYHLFFFLLPGMIHMSRNLFPFYEASYGYSEALSVSGLVLLYSVSSFLGVCVRLTKPQAVPAANTASREDTGRGKDFLLGAMVLLAISVPCIALTGFWLERRGDAIAADSEPSPLGLILTSLPSSAMFLCAILTFHIMRRRSFFSMVLFSLTAGLAFLVNYPLALTRFILFQRLIVMLYLALDLSRVRLKAYFAVIAVLAIFTVFPTVDFLTRGDTSYGIDIDPLRYIAESGDLDGLQSTLNVYQMVQSRGISWGAHALSTLLSYVPREIWPQKTYSTGTTAAVFAGYDFTNLSAPLVSEIYVDFGTLGVAIIPFFVGWLIIGLDLRAALIGRLHGHVIEKCFFGGLIGYETIILRGSLESIISQIYLYGLLVWLLVFICRPRRCPIVPVQQAPAKKGVFT